MRADGLEVGVWVEGSEVGVGAERLEVDVGGQGWVWGQRARGGFFRVEGERLV